MDEQGAFSFMGAPDQTSGELREPDRIEYCTPVVQMLHGYLLPEHDHCTIVVGVGKEGLVHGVT